MKLNFNLGVQIQNERSINNIENATNHRIENSDFLIKKNRILIRLPFNFSFLIQTMYNTRDGNGSSVEKRKTKKNS